MTGLRCTLFALAAAGLRYFAQGEAWAAERLLDAADWCEARTRPAAPGEGDPRRARPP